ncbi:hypothetical protein [Allofournierella sp.]|uniref:hypothetical protein n=1 Tax=Allofournierella sp. TaxID=1940256 RepID=UPI003AB5FEB1
MVVKKHKIPFTIATAAAFIVPLIYVVFRGIYYVGNFYAPQAQTAQGNEQALLNDKAYKYFKFVEKANGAVLIAALVFLLFLGIFLLFRLISFKNYAFLLLVFILVPFLYLKCLDFAVVGMAKSSSLARVVLVLRHSWFQTLLAATLFIYAVSELVAKKNSKKT